VQREKNARSLLYSPDFAPISSPRSPLPFPAAPSSSLFPVYFERCRRRLRFRRRMRFLRHCCCFFFVTRRRSRSRSRVSLRFFFLLHRSRRAKERKARSLNLEQGARLGSILPVPWLRGKYTSQQIRAAGGNEKRKLSRPRERERELAIENNDFQAGDRSRRGRRGEEQRELRRRASLLPLDSLVSNRDASSRPQGVPRASNQREKSAEARFHARSRKLEGSHQSLEKKREPSRESSSAPPRTALPARASPAFRAEGRREQ